MNLMALKGPNNSLCAYTQQTLACFLLLFAFLMTPSCLPPDFEVQPNQQVQIDRALLPISPDVFHDVSDCKVLSFDVRAAISDPDGDAISLVWLINYRQGTFTLPDAVNTRRYEFDPCRESKLVKGGPPLTLELFVLDRQPLSFDTADEAKTIDAPDTTTASVIWFIGADDLSCCERAP